VEAVVVKRTGRDLEPFRGKPAERGDSAAAHAEIQQLIAPIKVSYVDPSARRSSGAPFDSARCGNGIRRSELMQSLTS